MGAIVGGVGEKVFGGRGGFFALRFRFDVFEECGGGFESLASWLVFWSATSLRRTLLGIYQVDMATPK